MKAKFWKNDFVLIFSPEEAKEFGLSLNKKVEIKKIDEGILILLIKEHKKEKNEEEKILELLKKTPLNKRVEGVFEKFLNKEYFPIFKKLLKEGKVVKFKLSEKYKKAVYKIADEQMPKNTKKYWIFRNEIDAKKFSKENEEMLRSGKIKGIKGFDGKFYFISNTEYKKNKRRILDFLKGKKDVLLEDILNYLKIEKDLCLGVIEMLKEEGLIIEKKEHIYRVV